MVIVKTNDELERETERKGLLSAEEHVLFQTDNMTFDSEHASCGIANVYLAVNSEGLDVKETLHND